MLIFEGEPFQELIFVTRRGWSEMGPKVKTILGWWMQVCCRSRLKKNLRTWSFWSHFCSSLQTSPLAFWGSSAGFNESKLSSNEMTTDGDDLIWFWWDFNSPTPIFPLPLVLGVELTLEKKKKESVPSWTDGTFHRFLNYGTKPKNMKSAPQASKQGPPGCEDLMPNAPLWHSLSWPRWSWWFPTHKRTFALLHNVRGSSLIKQFVMWLMKAQALLCVCVCACIWTGRNIGASPHPCRICDEKRKLYEHGGSSPKMR